VCELRAHPGKYLGRQVTIQAEVLADGMHGIAYFDAHCKGSGLMHGWPLPNSDRSVEEFDRSIAGLELVPPHHRYSGTFVGQLEVDPKTKRMSYRLRSVSNLNEISVDSPASF